MELPIKIKLENHTIDLLNQGHVMVEANGTRWMHYPYWIKSTDEDGIFELYSVQQLPKHISGFLNDREPPEIDFLNFPHKQLDLFKEEEE